VKLKLVLIILFLMIAGIGMGFQIDEGVCNGAYRQKSIALKMIKPFVPGSWLIYFGVGNKHYDLQTKKVKSYSRVCKDLKTGRPFSQVTGEVGKHYLLDCVLVDDSFEDKTGCAVWHREGWRGTGDLFIDLMFWLPAKGGGE